MPRRMIGVGHGTLDTVFPDQGGANRLFASDFGAGDTSDGGKWDVSDGAGALSVVTDHGLPFPTTRILRVNVRLANEGLARLVRLGLGVPGVGESLFFRWYYRNMQPLTNDADTHPIESDQLNGFAWVMNSVIEDNATWWLNFQATGIELFWQQHWRCPVLTTGEVYRQELEYRVTSSTTFEYHARVHHCTLDGGNVVETLLYEDADFTNAFGSDGVTAGTVSFADQTQLPIDVAALADGLRAGCNGIGPPGNPEWDDGMHYSDQAGFYVSDEAFPGPYVPGEAD